MSADANNASAREAGQMEPAAIPLFVVLLGVILGVIKLIEWLTGWQP